MQARPRPLPSSLLPGSTERALTSALAEQGSHGSLQV